MKNLKIISFNNKIAEANKLNIRIWPKALPLQSNTPFSNVTNDARTNPIATAAKFLNSKQLHQFEIQRNIFLQKINHEMTDFISQMTNAIKIRTKWLQFSE